ncbi:VOC family protein [Dyella psychrodurans]|uniref:VOC family protein n=1 Tax=Dyella psychrodurans TaxID=1927960 RepID=A0A370XEB2_9GAMM|nr:VOC family protein [Dyella psychrodurans]RDS86627.1 VOC family protein [Dyella psychrodurans]
MHYAHGKFVWFEHHSNQRTEAQAFYRALFGWHFEENPMPDGSLYTMAKHGDHGIGGLRVSAQERGHWLGYVSVPDVDAATHTAVKHGGNVLTQPMDYGPMGRASVIADPQGAVFVLWKSAGGDAPDAPMPAIGSWCWMELLTTHDKAALTFYSAVAGYAHDVKDMGPMGTYYVLKHDGVQRAGVFQPRDIPMAIWVPYVNVPDCDAAAAKAGQLGATITLPPTDIPAVGRFALLTDPTGASLGVIAFAGA